MESFNIMGPALQFFGQNKSHRKYLLQKMVLFHLFLKESPWAQKKCLLLNIFYFQFSLLHLWCIVCWELCPLYFTNFDQKYFSPFWSRVFYMLPSYRITWICPMTFDNFPLDVQVLWYWTVPGNQSKSTLFIGRKELDLIWFRFVAFKLAASTMTSPRSSSRTSLWLSRARSSEFWRKSESEESQ